MKYLFILAIIFSSCSPVYIPNLRNSPLFTKAGEVQGAVQFGTGIDLQGAVAVTNHIGLMTNFSYSNRDNYEQGDEQEYHRHRFFEGGIGYYDNSDKWCYEIFAGYGQGKASHFGEYTFIDLEESKVSGKYNRFFIQPAFGLNKKVMHVSFVPRISLVTFTEFKDEISGMTISDFNTDPQVFFEPAVVGRVNFMENHIFFTFQAGLCIPAASDPYYDFSPFQIGTGLGVRIGGASREKE